MIGMQSEQIEMVWTCPDEGQWLNWQEDVRNTAARKKSKKRYIDAVKNNMKVVRLRTEDTEDSEMEENDFLQRPRKRGQLMEKAYQDMFTVKSL